MFYQKGKQTYRRIEIGEAKLSYEDLMTALQSLGITFNEFFHMVSETRSTASSKIMHQIECCQMGVNNTSEKEPDSLLLSIRAQSQKRSRDVYLYRY